MVRFWLIGFAITLAIEVPVAGILLRDREKSRLRLALLLIFANLATHPAVWFIFPQLPLGYWAATFLSEIFAWLAEALFYGLVFRVSAVRALAVSLVANAASYGAGVLLGSLGFWRWVGW